MAAPATRNTYSPETVTRALLALVAEPNARKACDLLAEQGIEIPHGTLSTWRTQTHRQQYESLTATYGQELEKQAVHNALVITSRAFDVQMLALDRAEDALKTRRDSSPSQTALNMGKVIQGAQETHARLTGRPTHVIEFKNADEALDSIFKKLGNIGAIDTTAEEAP